MKTIYLAGPISGCTYNEATEWRRYCIDNLKDKYKVISPIDVRHNYFGKDKLTFTSAELNETADTIFHKDIMYVEVADIILLYIDKPSYGTGFELGYAYSLGKQIVTVIGEGIEGHPFVEVPSSITFGELKPAVKYLLNYG